jgi:hypothetical protein
MHGSLDKLLTIVWLRTSLIEGNFGIVEVPRLELFGTNSGKIWQGIPEISGPKIAGFS